MKRRKSLINKRAMISLVMLVTSGLLVFSAVPLHLAASSGAGDFYHMLMTLHNTSAMIFILSLLVHISLNRRAIKNHIVQKMVGARTIKKEMIIACVIIIAIEALSLSHAFHLS